MKRIVSLFLAALLLLPLLVACTKGPEQNTESEGEESLPFNPPSESNSSGETESDSSKSDPSPTFAVDPSHAKSPLMGWASWNLYHTDISEKKILDQAQALKNLGLSDLGYTFVNIDDGFQLGRDENGSIVVHPTRFPSGMKTVATAIHNLDLYAGIYSDAGELTCGYLYSGETTNDHVGLYGYEEQDLTRFLEEWDYDFIKVDWCGGATLGLSRKEQYLKIGSIIQSLEAKIGKNIIYNICCWEFPGDWATEVADSWRTGSDITPNFASVLYQLDRCKSLSSYQSAGHVNDPDMLEVGMGMSYEEDKSHFAMWCMLSAPLMLGMDLNRISEETLTIISNKNLIAIDQDPACLPASVVLTLGDVEIWQKDLGTVHSSNTAIALLNRSEETKTVTLIPDMIGYQTVSSMKNLWTEETRSSDSSPVTITLAPHETCVLQVQGTRNNADQGTQASITFSNAPEKFNLSELGQTDWLCLGSMSGRTGFVKNIEQSLLSLHFFDTVSTAEAEESYCSWQGDGTGIVTGFSATGSAVYGTGTGFGLAFPARQSEQVLQLLIGIGSASINVELYDGTHRIASQTIPGISANEISERVISLNFSAPTERTLTLRVSIGEAVENSMLALYGAALSPVARESELSLADPALVKQLLSENALLLDVRSEQEFMAGHAENAVHLSYDEILSSAAKQLEDFDTVILVYCSRGKRSLQAAALLRWLGYTNVYAVGGLDRLKAE